MQQLGMVCGGASWFPQQTFLLTIFEAHHTIWCLEFVDFMCLILFSVYLDCHLNSCSLRFKGHIKESSCSSCKEYFSLIYLDFHWVCHWEISWRDFEGDVNGFSNYDLWSHTKRSPHDAIKHVHPKPFKLYSQRKPGGLPILLFSTFKILRINLGRSSGSHGTK